MSGDLEEREVTISGVKVVFPCKPYPSQFGMMDRVIKGLERGQNCLLESPTGSGKSLALLCSALAWQNALHLKYAKDAMSGSNSGTKEENVCQACHCKRESKGKEQNGSGQQSKVETVNGPSQDSVIVLDGDESDDDDFKVQSKYRTPGIGQSKAKKRGHVSISYDDNSPSTQEVPQEQCTCNTASPSTSSKPKVPKIYFGTRTHKQIAQIVRELRKTAYHDVRMAILASREYTCVHHEVVKLKNKSEGCRERLDVNGPGCTFNDRAKRVFLNQGQLQNELNSAWDLEELVHACKGKRACPYFVTRNIKDQADIIFCPYNYLIDPLVRKSMEINLKDQIVILDEAHNIEDCARDAASGQLTTEQITQTIHNLQELLDANVKFSDHLTLKRMMENVMKFVDDNSTHLDQADYDTSYKVWSGFDMVARLKSIGLGPDTLDEYKSCLDNISASDEDQQQNTMRNFRNLEIKLHSSSIKILELLLQILDYMYRDELKFVEDYRVAVLKSMQYVSTFNSNDSWLGKNRRGRTREVVFTLNFWCMNPAVAFSDFTPCRNVVLSSGTLSPMTSFASELGVPFPIQLEANHIIKEEQVWVGSIGSGPSGSQLQAVYKNMETFSFQDELGNFIVQVCQNVPHGVLCFLPSYRALDKFTERWKLTRVWEKLSAHKKVLVEPRAGDREDFDHMMKMFYEVVRDPSCSDDENGDYVDTSDRNGALFLAVCRGKVSEGMDFADNNARAVITVGIPFPSIKDLQVKLKREYNDKYRAERGLLSGNEWYEIQAFRALNQALGRCIRHRKDWGAIIIVDDRFVRMAGKYCKGLSKWVRNKVQTFEAFPKFLDSLSSFTDRMKKEMPTINPDTSFIPSTPSTPAAQRRSVYNQNCPNTSTFTSPPSENMSSPYFMKRDKYSPKVTTGAINKVESSPRVTNTLIHLEKDKSPITPDNTHNNTNTDNLVHTVYAPSIPGLPLNTQLLSIMNSAAVPKDKPYCIVLNKGFPNEQMFYVDPAKTGLATSKGSPTNVQAPSRSLLTQTLNNVGSPGPPKISIPSQIQNSVEITKQPNSNIATQMLNNKDGNKQPMKTFAITCAPGQPIMDQLKQILSSPSLPKDESYYMIFNRGTPQEQTLLIEPNKQGKSDNQGGSSKDSSEGSKTVDPVQVPSDIVVKKEEKIEAEDNPEGSKLSDQGPGDMVVKKEDKIAVGSPVPKVLQEPHSNIPTPVLEESNKFLKFCKLTNPNTNKIPVAAVTPQPKQQVLREKLDNPRESTVSPVLFEQSSEETTCTDKNQITDNTSTLKYNTTVAELGDPLYKRKPIFKKELNSNSNVKVELQADDIKATSIGESVVKEENEAKLKAGGEKDKTAGNDESISDVLVSDTMSKISRGDTPSCNKDQMPQKQDSSIKKRTSRGKFDRSVIEKLKTGRRKTIESTVHMTETSPTRNEKEALQDITSSTTVAQNQNQIETDSQSDEEFLCTRRKSGRKRLSNGKNKQSSKRQKGVQYVEEMESNQENKDVVSDSLTCFKCGNVILKMKDTLGRKECPKFIQKLCGQKQTTVFTGMIPDVKETSLKVVTNSDKGCMLDSLYVSEDKCCVQYLQCDKCPNKDQPVVGARILMTEKQSKFTVGQAWIISSAVKT